MPTPQDDVSWVLAALGDTEARLDGALLGEFLEELFRWNPQIGLVSKRDTPALVVRLLRKSLALWDFVRDALGETRWSAVERIVDIGTGGGFPGLVWKMLSPEREFLLLERRERKAAFVERVVARTALRGVSVEAADVREVALRESCVGRFQLATMTAVADPKKVVRSVERLLATPGYFCTIRASEQPLPGECLGRRLTLLAYSDVPDGRFVLYGDAALGPVPGGGAGER